MKTSSVALRLVNKFFPKVDSVVDARSKAQIEVTAQDATSRAVKSHSACAMAVACKRKFNLDGVIISRSVAYLVKGKQARRFHLPSSVSREIVSFDRGSGFSPGKYELSAIAKANRLGARIQRPKDHAQRDGHPKKFRHITTNVRSVLGGQDPEAPLHPAIARRK